MKKIIIENLISSEKTAVMENDRLIELIIDNKQSIVSNVYRGIVKKKLDGLGACFVDIGLEKLAYLKLNKEDTIKNGEEILVQVNKDEIGDKGCKLNLEVSISGRFLVYIPNNYKNTISNKIKKEEDRTRLMNLLESVTDEKGFIIRTESLNATDEELKKDICELNIKYQEIIKELKLGIGPKILYKNDSKSIKFIKDNLNDKYDEIVLNSDENRDIIKGIIKDLKLETKLSIIENEDIFNLYKIDSELSKALNKKVWLKSGGYLIIEKTEALTVVDVNSGKFTKGYDLEKTSFKTNYEASVEICRQMKLRDIGGIVIVDFIEMKNKENELEIIKVLNKEIKKDRRTTNVLGFTKLGLVEIARRREKESIDNYYLEDVECENSFDYFLDNLEKEVIRIKNHTSYNKITICINEKTNHNLKSSSIISDLNKKYEIVINLELDLYSKNNAFKVKY